MKQKLSNKLNFYHGEIKNLHPLLKTNRNYSLQANSFNGETIRSAMKFRARCGYSYQTAGELKRFCEKQIAKNEDVVCQNECLDFDKLAQAAMPAAALDSFILPAIFSLFCVV